MQCFKLVARDRQTDGQTDRLVTALLNVPHGRSIITDRLTRIGTELQQKMASSLN